jgi:hypothetical protein
MGDEVRRSRTATAPERNLLTALPGRVKERRQEGPVLFLRIRQVSKSDQHFTSFLYNYG